MPIETSSCSPPTRAFSAVVHLLHRDPQKPPPKLLQATIVRHNKFSPVDVFKVGDATVRKHRYG